MEPVMLHSVSHSISFNPHNLLESVHCKEFLARFRASGFCYIINAGASLGLFLDIILLSGAISKILLLWI